VKPVNFVIAALLLIYPATGWADECMATLADANGYSLKGFFPVETATK
jgi:hypothetical protein